VNDGFGGLVTRKRQHGSSPLTDSNISLDDIKSAERIVGIEFTATERAQMLENLTTQIEFAQLNRKVSLDNSVPMATRFDPRLPGFEMPTVPNSIVVSQKTVALPIDDEDIAFATLPELAAWISNGVLTSRRLTEIYLERIEKLNAKLECFALVTPDVAIAQADEADALTSKGKNLGPLHGIPYGLKDLFDTKDITTGWGAEPFQHRIPQSDAAVVTLLREAGAVLLGKTAVGALAYDNIWYGGETRNPWNLNEGSSGSSAGSASAVAAGLCGFAIGTETLGSITSPSNRCGTTGLRPTFGRVSRAGCMALCNTLDKIGPICRGVEDTAMVLAAINGSDLNDHSSVAIPFHFDVTQKIEGLRLGYIPEAFGKGANEVDQAALSAAKELGLETREVSLPDLPYDSLMNILIAESAATFEQLTLENADDSLKWQGDNAWPNTFRKARFLSAVDHVQLERLRYLVMQALDAVFKEVDVLIGPFATGPMLVASNFTGHPCLHLRAGFRHEATRSDKAQKPARSFVVPHGISLWGPLFQEGTLINFGMALEQKLAVAKQRPQFPS